MAETTSNPSGRSLPDGVVPEEIVAHTEKRWLITMSAMLAIMMVVVVLSSVMSALRPASNVEVIDPETLHLGGEFVESNLGTAIEPDGSATVRLIAQQYDFVPACVNVPIDTPVRFRLTSADVVHGFLLPDTNTNTMVVPGFVAEIHAQFSRLGEYEMPCHEFCGPGHHGMWTHVRIVPKEDFRGQDVRTRTRCARK